MGNMLSNVVLQSFYTQLVPVPCLGSQLVSYNKKRKKKKET